MTLNFRHSGQLGDIIYAIPAMQAIAHRRGLARFTLYVPNNILSGYAPEMKHIGGKLMISQGMFDYFEPLLKAQSYVEAVHYLPLQQVPDDAVDLDIVRAVGLNMSAGNIKDFYYKVFAVLADTPRRWIEPGGRPEETPYDILISRSARYLNMAINYGVLAHLGLRIGFIGLDSEFIEFRTRFPDLPVEHVLTRDALHACKHIAASSLFISNQSFFFAIAEALQVNRLLEVYEPAPNVVPSGGRCGQFLTTHSLGKLLSTFYCRDIHLSAEDLRSGSDFAHSL